MISPDMADPISFKPLDAEREKLRGEGFTDAEISQILIARELGAFTPTPAQMPPALGAALKACASSISALKSNIMTFLHGAARARMHVKRALSLMVIGGSVVGVGYFTYQEWKQHVASARAKECDAKFHALLDETDHLNGADPGAMKVFTDKITTHRSACEITGAQWPAASEMQKKLQAKIDEARKPLEQATEQPKPPPAAAAPVKCFTFNGQSECVTPVDAHDDLLRDKTIVFKLAFQRCQANPRQVKFLRSTEHLSGKVYLAPNGKAYVFASGSDDVGFIATINAGEQSGFTIRDLTGAVYGRQVTRTHQAPATTNVRLTRSELAFSYAWHLESTWPDGSPMTGNRSAWVDIKLSPQSACSILDAKFSDQLTSGRSIDQDFSCAGAVTEICKITDGRT